MAFQDLFTFTKAVTLAATPEALFSARQPACRLDIQALIANTSTVTIQLTGDAAGRGITLNPGEVYTFDFAAGIKMNYDASKIFIRVAVNGEGVTGFGQTA